MIWSGWLMEKNIKDKELFNTHRMFDVEEFIFDDIKHKLNDKMDNYRDEFLPNREEKNVTSDNGMWLMIVPLIEELKFYYNNDFCLSIALSIAISESDKFNLRTHSYYYENAIFRIESTWEYLFIILNEFLQTGLSVGIDVKEAKSEASCHKIDFVKHGYGYRVVATKLPDEIIAEAKSQLNKNNILFNISQNNKSNAFLKEYKKKFVMNDSMRKLFDIYKSDAVKKIIELRNEIIHRRPLGAKFSVEPSVLVPGQGVGIKPTGWFDITKLPDLLEKNIYALKFAIQTLVDIIFNNDVPNSKVNGDKIFFVYKVQCMNCDKELLINDFTVEYFERENLKLLCPFCSSKNTKVGNKQEVHDRYYFDNIMEYYRDAISKYDIEK